MFAGDTFNVACPATRELGDGDDETPRKASDLLAYLFLGEVESESFLYFPINNGLVVNKVDLLEPEIIEFLFAGEGLALPLEV